MAKQATTEEPRAAATTRAACLCGCGATPLGRKARFITGHDGRLMGNLLRRAYAGDGAALEELAALGWSKFFTPKGPKPAKVGAQE